MKFVADTLTANWYLHLIWRESTRTGATGEGLRLALQRHPTLSLNCAVTLFVETEPYRYRVIVGATLRMLPQRAVPVPGDEFAAIAALVSRIILSHRATV